METICTSLQIDNHTTQFLQVGCYFLCATNIFKALKAEKRSGRFCAPEALPGTQLTLRAPRGIAYKALTPPITI